MVNHDIQTNWAGQFSIFDLFVAISTAAIFFGLLASSLNQEKGGSRRTWCLKNMRQLGLAIQNYQSSHLRYPPAMGSFSWPNPDPDYNRISGLVYILSELEQARLYEAAFEADPLPPPWDKNFEAWQSPVDLFRCPSAPDGPSDYPKTNYAFCIGDVARDIHNPQLVRGAFACGLTTDQSEITDGTSNTIAMAEMGTSKNRRTNSHFATDMTTAILNNPSLVLRLYDPDRPNMYRKKTALHPMGRGASWPDGGAGFGIVNTILPPNQPSASVADVAADGIYTAGSFHNGGCIITLADGSARFLADTIDAGDPAQPVPYFAQMARPGLESPYGVWGALGTANGNEDSPDLDW